METPQEFPDLRVMPMNVAALFAFGGKDENHFCYPDNLIEV